MNDYSELKRLAEAAVTIDYKAPKFLDKYMADTEAFQIAASPSVVLAILAELEALRKVMEATKHILRDSRSNEFSELANAVDAYEAKTICGVHAHNGAQHAPSLGCKEICTEPKGHNGGRHDQP